jgi:hypothetical protein
VNDAVCGTGPAYGIMENPLWFLEKHTRQRPKAAPLTEGIRPFGDAAYARKRNRSGKYGFWLFAMNASQRTGTSVVRV